MKQALKHFGLYFHINRRNKRGGFFELSTLSEIKPMSYKYTIWCWYGWADSATNVILWRRGID